MRSKKQPTSKPKAPKAPKLVRDEPTFGGAAVVRRIVSEDEGARLQSRFGWRLTSRNADGSVTMSATSEAYAAELAAR